MIAVARSPLSERSPRRLARDEDQSVVLHGVPWSTYVLLDDAFDQPGVKVSYDRGALEIMTKSPRHELGKKVVARLLELWAIERDVRIYGYGETTFREEMNRAGIEPDECYTIGRPLQQVPDLVIEVVVSKGMLDKLPIYRSLGVREVWIYDNGAIAVHRLGPKGYRLARRSALLPGLDVSLLARHASMPDQHDAALAFRDAIRGEAERARARPKRGKRRKRRP
jgi:Uma2 family endonuclease